MTRKFKDMNAPEQLYRASQAPRLRGQASADRSDAHMHDNVVWGVGRKGRRGYDPKRAEASAAERDRLYERASQQMREAAEAEAAVKPEKKKRSWW